MTRTRRQEWDLRRLRTMARACPSGLVLDVGFASAPNPYLQGRVVGLDVRPSPPPPNYWAAVVSTAEALPVRGKAKAVCAGELIEHLASPLSFLVECNQALMPGGILIISTPNPHYAAEFLKNLFGRTANLFADTHLYLLSYRTLHKLLDIAGFAVLERRGTYIKVPGLPFRVPTPLFPTLSHNLIFISRKEKDIRAEDVPTRLRREYERAGGRDA